MYCWSDVHQGNVVQAIECECYYAALWAALEKAPRLFKVRSHFTKGFESFLELHEFCPRLDPTNHHDPCRHASFVLLSTASCGQLNGTAETASQTTTTTTTTTIAAATVPVAATTTVFPMPACRVCCLSSQHLIKVRHPTSTYGKKLNDLCGNHLQAVI